MPIKEIKQNIWTKNWSAKWKASFASLYELYITGLKKYTGKNLSMSLLICEKNVSSNFLAKKELDDYGLYLAKIIIKNPNLANKWIKDSLNSAKKLIEIVNEIKRSPVPSLNQIKKLKNAFYLHIPPHFSIKKVIDYLPKPLQKTLNPKFLKVRQKTENLFNEVNEALIVFTRYISKKTGLKTTYTDFLTVDEIIDFLKTSKLTNLQELKKRNRGVAFFYLNKNSNVYTNTDYKKIQKHLFGRRTISLKGTAAYKGLTVGSVKIVFDPYKAKNFKTGDILITGMTRPEFLPLMKKAAAFVTDAGGMLSHAAIMARELKKPCILGTESATKIFKNGDLVEVDANKGTVRKIK